MKVEKRQTRSSSRLQKLREGKFVSNPYCKTGVITTNKKTVRTGSAKYKDTGDGFLLGKDSEATNDFVVTEQKLSVIDTEGPNCEKCSKPIGSSWLMDNFAYNVCDSCKNQEENILIAKTIALNKYLLKERDLDTREPPLKFIEKNNPHNPNWRKMKLYLQVQVEKRALEVWGSKEKIQEELKKREEKRAIANTKKYHKKMKNMRSSLYDESSSGSQTHEFGPETYNEEDDYYIDDCRTCQLVHQLLHEM